MPVDDRPFNVRHSIRGIEVAFSVLVLAIVATAVSSLEPRLGDWIVWVIFLIPGTLAVASLLGAGVDVFGVVSGTGTAQPRRRVLGTLLVAGATGILATITLLLIVQTVLTVTVGTGGGVLFGPILFTFTGGLLAIVVLTRAVGRRYVEDTARNRRQNADS